MTRSSILAFGPQGQAFLRYGHGGGTFAPAISHADEDGAGLAVVDVDGDGRPDLVTYDPAQGYVSILRNTCH